MRLRTLAVALIAVCGSAFVGGCGGGGGGGAGGGGAPFTVTSAFPAVLPSGTPTALSVLGTSFGAVGANVVVRFEAVSGTPFSNGTAPSVDVGATVTGATTIDGPSVVVAGFSGTVPAYVGVVRADGEYARSALPICTLEGLTVSAATPSELVSFCTTELEVTGSDFRPIGGLATVRLLALAGAPFFHATAEEITTTATIESATTVRCTVPPARANAQARVAVTLANGASALLGGASASVGFAGDFRLAGLTQTAGDQCGKAVAVLGSEVFAGRPGDDTLASEAGAVLVFGPTSDGGYGVTDTLYANDAAAYDLFGLALAANGEWLAIGSSSGQGAVYMFRRIAGTWTFQQRLTSPDKLDLGRALALDGTTLIAGSGVERAVVFTFDGTTWAEQAVLQPTGGTNTADFGYQVGVAGDIAVTGGQNDTSPSGVASGVAYVFRRTGTTWTQETRLYPSTGDADDRFGYSVAATTNRVVVGAIYASFFHTVGGPNYRHGAAFVFDHNGSTWTESAKLQFNNATSQNLHSELGFAVAVQGDAVLASARMWDGGFGQNTGAGFLFRKGLGGWGVPVRVEAGEVAQFGSTFGWSVALDDDLVVIGCPEYVSDDGKPGGAAFTFEAGNR
jgi:hypothetical protein